jgi:N4-bis(aminopropyl)spermidine synthase
VAARVSESDGIWMSRRCASGALCCECLDDGRRACKREACGRTVAVAIRFAPSLAPAAGQARAPGGPVPWPGQACAAPFGAANGFRTTLVRYHLRPSRAACVLDGRDPASRTVRCPCMADLQLQWRVSPANLASNVRRNILLAYADDVMHYPPKAKGTKMPEIDLKAAINAVSDVVQNRPRPLREFDQIYMKTGDMVMQSEFVASWADNRRLAFIGDGDSISVCVAYLHARGIIDYGPSTTTVFDFDERIVSAINRFADQERIENLQAVLYNCLDPLPQAKMFECFYTNPPWGASNRGESVNIFVQRGIEATRHVGEGLIVIADDDELTWPGEVLFEVQSYASHHGFYVSRMLPRLHSYHLDDAPDLRSCNLMIKARPSNKPKVGSQPIVDEARLSNFYGRDAKPRVRYVRERKRVDYGRASEGEYEFELLNEAQ